MLLLMTFFYLTSLFLLLVKQISEQNLEIKNLQSLLQEKNAREVGKLLLAEQQYHIKTPKMKPTSTQQETELNVRLNNLILEHRLTESALKEVSFAHRTFHRKCFLGVVTYLVFIQKHVTFFFPWQKIEKVETEIESLLQNFDDEIGENQVQKTKCQKLMEEIFKRVFTLDSSSCAC